MYQSKAGGLATGRATLQAQRGQGCPPRPQASGKQRTPKGDRGKVKGPQPTEMCPASKVLGRQEGRGFWSHLDAGSWAQGAGLRELDSGSWAQGAGRGELGGHTPAMPTPSPPEGALSALTEPLARHTFSKSSSGT